MEYYGDNAVEGSRINEDVSNARRGRYYRLVKRKRSLPAVSSTADLVACDRYAARLQVAACVARYRASVASLDWNGRGEGSMAATGCRGCEQGKGRATNER